MTIFPSSCAKRSSSTNRRAGHGQRISGADGREVDYASLGTTVICDNALGATPGRAASQHARWLLPVEEPCRQRPPHNSPARAEWIRRIGLVLACITGGWPARHSAAARGPSRANFSHGPTVFSRHARSPRWLPERRISARRPAGIMCRGPTSSTPKSYTAPDIRFDAGELPDC